MTRIAAITGLGLALACLSAQASAKGEIPFEKAKGWSIDRTAPDANNRLCMMSKSYRDPDDNNAENAVFFILKDGKAVITLAYEKWGFDKDEKVPAAIILDKRTVVAKSTWTGDDTSLTTMLPDTIVPNLLAAKTLILKFDDGKADFDLAGFPEAYESLRRCDATPANVASATPAPAAPVPSENLFAAYFMGATVETALKECDIPTTPRQRAAFGERMAALRKELGPAVAQAQAEMDKHPAPGCPPAAEVPGVLTMMQDIVDKSPDEFVSMMDKRRAEKAKNQSNP